MRIKFIITTLILSLFLCQMPAGAAEGLSAQYDGKGVTISGSVGEASAPVTVIIGKTGVTIEEIASVAAAQAQTKIEYINTVTSDENGVITAFFVPLKEDLATGECGVFVRTLGGELYQAATFYCIENADIEEIVGLFNDKTPEKYGEIFLPETGAENILGRLGADMTAYAGLQDKSAFYNILASHKPFVRDEQQNVEAVTVLIDAFNLSCALSELNESTAPLSVIEKYNGKWWNIAVGEGSDYAALSSEKQGQLLASIQEQSFTTPEMLETAFQNEVSIQMFASCKTRDDMENVISKYNSYYLLDLTLLDNSSFSAYHIVQIYNLMLDGCGSCADMDDISDLYTGAVREIKNTITSTNTGSSSSGGGGGRGNSGGGGSFQIPAAQDPAQNPVEDKPADTEATEPGMKFYDVEQTHWAYEYISALFERGIVSGVSETEFQPDRTISREEFVKLLIAEFYGDELDADAQCVFSDVDENHYAVPYIMKAYEKQIVSGIGDGIFGLGMEIKRQDAAIILSKLTADYQPENKATAQTAFADSQMIDSYAAQAVAAVAELGLFTGDEQNYFHPHKGITRAEACAVIARVISLIEEGIKV